METASDAEIWDFALWASVAITTKDEDFAQRKVLTEKGPVVIYLKSPRSRSRPA